MSYSEIGEHMIEKFSYSLYSKLDRDRRVEVLRNIIAYDSFLGKLNYTKRISNISVPGYGYVKRGIGKIIKDSKTTSIYFKEKKKKEQDEIVQIIDQSNNNEFSKKEFELELFEYLNRIEHINDAVFIAFFYNPLEMKEYSIKWEYDYKQLYLNRMGELQHYQFLLGTGVSFDYGAKPWKKVIEEMEMEIMRINPFLYPKGINASLFNTPYGIPQILKDLNQSLYYSSIYSSLYGSGTFVSVKNSNLYSVAKCIERQWIKNPNQNTTILTYNYDDFLEKEFNSIPFDCISDYANNKIPIDNSPMTIVKHLHGFLPYEYISKPETIKKEFEKTIVLTDIEYNDAYEKESLYAISNLTSFLEKSTIIVGNSVTDYEERKVFRKKKNGEGPFHFLLRRKYIKDEEDKFDTSNPVVDDYYIFSYFLQIGIITIFVNNHSEIKTIIDSLD